MTKKNLSARALLQKSHANKPSAHDEAHLSHRAGWLRAAVLGANDGIISVASLVVGVAAAAVDAQGILLAGVAGTVAGALSMAAGEYVSVSSQSDMENADLEKERSELARVPQHELNELAAIYQWRGLSKNLARQVAVALTKHNDLEAHARDELGISDFSVAHPLQAAVASAISFMVGAGLPLLMVWLVGWRGEMAAMVPSVVITTIATLALLGAVGAKLGGAPLLPAIGRVLIWGVLAMVATFAIGKIFNVVIGG